MLSKVRQLGPGVLVAAAFIGAGTVKACTLAGANFGYSLLSALVFATLATIILQEMSAWIALAAKQIYLENSVIRLIMAKFYNRADLF